MSRASRCSLVMQKVKSVATTNNNVQNDSLVECDGEMNKLQKLLELLNTTNDVDFQSKILSAISAYLIFNNRINIKIIIKCNALYDKIYNVLSKGPPRKATDALNFLSALLYVDADEETSTRKALAIYARNMTRVSGCLGAMSEMFCSNMMYLDTWKALCQCLAVACGECEVNQSYCTHLVPICIPKCSQENIDVFLVLQALLFNHNRNVKLFLESNGLSVFNRELLHYDKCLQLLTTVAQCPMVPPLALKDTPIFNHLHDFIKQYGSRSQIGQKALIILNHIQSRSKGTNHIRNLAETIETCRNTQKLINTTTRKRTANVTKAKSISVFNPQKDFDETNKLMQNVMREVFQFKQDEVAKLRKSVSKRNNIGKLQPDKRKFVRNISHNLNKATSSGLREDLHLSVVPELSFSFLNNIQDSNLRKKPYEITNYDEHRSNLNKRYDVINSTRMETNTSYKDDTEAIDVNDFIPKFVSTPKHSQDTNGTEKSNCYETLTNLHINADNRNIDSNSKPQSTLRKPQHKKYKDIQNRSLSSRFFSAINDSCTTFVKSVKSMFKKKENPEETKDSLALNSTENKYDELNSQFSFTNYMKKRDAVLNSKNNVIGKKQMNTSNFSIETGSCRTCDNTQELRQKLIKDEHLKQTLKKLKLGINLYGCDFKKISKLMWPRESYMTPTILYNLYRKLILK